MVGHDASAKAVVIELIDKLGFDGVDAGGLDDSWRQQPGTPVYTTDLGVEGVRKAGSGTHPASDRGHPSRGAGLVTRFGHALGVKPGALPPASCWKA